MPLISAERTIELLRKMPVVLNALLRDVTQEQAQQMTDGPGGWNLVYILSHMRDYEPIYRERIRQMVERDNPQLPWIDNQGITHTNDYAHQDLRQMLDEYLKGRRDFVQMLEGLSEEQWTRRGSHPTYGEGTMYEMVLNCVVHDINHIEQVARVVGLSEAVI